MTFQTSQRIKYRMNLSLIDLADSDNRHTESPGRRDNRISTSYFGFFTVSKATQDLSISLILSACPSTKSWKKCLFCFTMIAKSMHNLSSDFFKSLFYLQVWAREPRRPPPPRTTGTRGTWRRRRRRTCTRPWPACPSPSPPSCPSTPSCPACPSLPGPARRPCLVLPRPRTSRPHT